MSKIINNTVDKLTGFHIEDKLKEILEFDTYSREEIEKYHLEKFDKLKTYACQTPIYKHSGDKKIEDFPKYTREFMKENIRKFVVSGVKPFKTVYTSGSTGKPMPVYVTKEMLLAKRASHQKMLHWYGLTREAREFKIGGLPQNRKTLLYYRFRNKRFINSFSIKQKNLFALAKRYNKFKPEILYGYPTSILNLVQFSKMQNIQLHSPILIATHAEKLTKNAIEEFKKYFPKVNVVDQYWSTEANIGVTCPEGKLHIDEDTIICEVVNKDKNGFGDLLITNLFSYAFPYIRYPIGDRVKLSDKPCQCGRNTKVIEEFKGRDNDNFTLPDGRIIPYTAITLDDYSKNIIAYQLFYKPKDKVMIYGYIPIDEKKPIEKDGISAYIKSEYGLKAEYRVLSEVVLTKGGKFKPLIEINA